MGARFYSRRQKSRYGNTSWSPTVQYRHKSDDLWKQYQEGTIDSGTYSQSLEQIKNEEIATIANRSFGILTPEDSERLESDIWAYEHRQQDIREQVAQRKAEVERIKSRTPLEKYKEEIPETIQNFRTESNSYRSKANFYQILIIAGSVLTTSASSAVVFGVNGIWRLIAPAISIVVTISAGLTAYFKFREKSFNLQQTADTIEQEYVAIELGIGNYRDKDKQPQEALQRFAERVEFMKDEQKKRQQQLEQPPDIKHGHNPP